MKNFVRWLTAIYRWIWRAPIARHYWWTVAVVSICIVVVGLSGWTEKSFRLAGMCMQLGGVLTVVWGIWKTRTEFGQLTVRSQLKAWGKTFPPLHPPSISITTNGKLTGLAGSIDVYSTHGPAADQSIEGRVKHLESIVNKLGVAQHMATLRAEKKAQETLDLQARQFSDQVDAVAKKIESTATGGVHVSAVGVVLLFVGTAFGGAALELHKLLTQ